MFVIREGHYSFVYFGKAVVFRKFRLLSELIRLIHFFF